MGNIRHRWREYERESWRRHPVENGAGRTAELAGNVLFLHAGDAVQGTLYFNVFQGDADFDFLNYLGVDAMTFGNHEFDKGAAFAGRFVAKASFPILSANIDVTREPSLAGKVAPFLIKRTAPSGLASSA